MNLIESTEQLFDQALTTMKAKNQDYGGKDRSTGLYNFELSASVAKVSTEQGILIRLMDKMARIGNLLDTEAAVKSESLQDTLEDAINYCAILHYAIKERDDSRR